jgi:uncharacterized protein YigE (DUF2233 family)
VLGMIQFDLHNINVAFFNFKEFFKDGMNLALCLFAGIAVEG